jgi:hypothetical protein
MFDVNDVIGDAVRVIIRIVTGEIEDLPVFLDQLAEALRLGPPSSLSP